MFLPIGDDVDRRDFPYIPALLIFLNLFVFAYQIRIFNTAEDPEFGAELSMDFIMNWGLIPSELMKGQFIGLFTHMFLHGGLSHIIGNMIVLWAFALSLEVGLGKWQLLGFYIVWGLVGGLTHALMDPSSEIPLVGASGAIAGVMGAYTVAYGFASRIKALIFIMFRPFLVRIPAVLFGMGWFGLQIWEASNDPSGDMSGVAWGAHIGGFASGALTMFLFRNSTNSYLVEVNGKLMFRKREDDEYEYESELEGQGTAEAVLESLPAPCPYCGVTIPEPDEDDPSAGGPLVRCQECRGLLFLSGEMVS